MNKKPSKIVAAQGVVRAHIEETGKAVYSQKDLYALIDINRNNWDLPQTTTPNRIVQRWIEIGLLNAHTFVLSNGEELLYFLHGEPSIYEIAVDLRSKSYISHYPAVYLHDLTTQVPKTIYTTQELSAKRQAPRILTQEGIHKAFSVPQRRSQLTTEFGEYTIVLLSGKHSSRSGVLLSTRNKSAFSLTNVERTLIDITVRPNYAGGAFAVLDAFQKAVLLYELSSNKFMATLKQLSFIYPYQQAIGFYLERCQYTGRLLDVLRNEISEFEFYLDYDMQERTFNKEWKIWHPIGM